MIANMLISAQTYKLNIIYKNIIDNYILTDDIASVI